MSRRRSPRMALLLAGVLAGCGPEERRGAIAPAASSPRKAEARPGPIAPRAGLSELEPGATLPTAAGQRIYLPIFSRVGAEDARAIKLAVNVAVRNTDEGRPIIVTVLRHRDADGRTLRDYLRIPVRLAPGAMLDVVVKEPNDLGSAASVLVEWVADRPVAPPIVEAVMVGAAGSQAISFVERGRVVEDRQHPAGPPR